MSTAMCILIGLGISLVLSTLVFWAACRIMDALDRQDEQHGEGG